MLNTPPKLHDKDTVFARFIRPKVYPDKPQEKSRRLSGALQWGEISLQLTPRKKLL